MRLYVRAIIVAAVVLGTAVLTHAQTLRWLGTLGGNMSWAQGVTPDGKVVVGGSYDSRGEWHAFRWTSTGGMQDLGTLGGVLSWAFGVSADGNVVVGNSFNGDGFERAFRWTVEEGMQDLGTLGGDESNAYAISADGRVVVGWAQDANGNMRAFRWTAEEGMQDLGTLGGDESAALGISADGRVIVGWADDASGQDRAFRWTAEEGMQDLGTLGGAESVALAVSADGRVVVGISDTGSARYAFRWTASGGMQSLGTLSIGDSIAYSVSAEGNVVVGWGSGLAFRWTPASGMQNLSALYDALLADGSFLTSAEAVSLNGRYIVGGGSYRTRRRNEAFLLDTGAASSYALSGHVQLLDFVGDYTQVPVTVELRQDEAITATRTVYPDAVGRYTLHGVLPGVYDVAFKAPHWLRAIVRQVDVRRADVKGVSVSLLNGDVDGDNEVTLTDLGVLIGAFGSVPGEQNWNPNADLNGDGEVSLYDFSVLVRSFGRIGEE